MSRIDPVDGEMHSGAHMVAGVPADALLLHQLVVAGIYLLAVNDCVNSVTGDFLHVFDPGTIDHNAVCFPNGFCNGVVRVTFCVSRILQKLTLGNLIRMNGSYVEHAPGQGACLIKYYDICCRQSFQVIAALDQDPLSGCTANTAEKAQRNGNNQRTGAGYYKEDQCPVQPVDPVTAGYKRGDQSQQQRCDHHAGSIIFGEFCNEILGGCFFAACIFHQLQDLGYGGFSKCVSHSNSQQTTFVDAAADNIITNRYASGNRFTSQRSSIQCGAALQHDPIQRNSFAGLYHNGVSDGNLIRIHFFQFAVLLQICIVRSDVHQRRNGFPGFAHRIAFKQLTDPVEQHNYHRFRILLGTDGAYGGKHHQEVFVKNLAVGNVPQCF